MSVKGNSERQAFLRNEMIKREKRTKRSNYVLKISAVIKPGMKLLDVGCGTAHIIGDLAALYKDAIFVGLDVSPAMLKIAKLNTMRLPNVMLVEGNGLKLPFTDRSFNIAITRLAEYSPQEVYRVLKKRRVFL
ncbi:MAG: class I SAM-dependent methyltransferase [Candidatus Bathyarchaeia archaeon]